MIGRFTTGSSGLGIDEVIGRSRVPSPPAITTAFMIRWILFPDVKAREKRAVAPVAFFPPPFDLP